MKGSNPGSGIAPVLHPAGDKDLRFPTGDTLKNFVCNVLSRRIRRVWNGGILLSIIVVLKFPYRVSVPSVGS